MNLLDLFLREHARVHMASMEPGHDRPLDWLIAGLPDEQWREGPDARNPLAWLWWHVARVEDSVALVVCGQPQVVDADWKQRMGVTRRDVGEGMTRDEVRELSATIALPALREYRDVVGRRTRELARGLWPDRWHTPIDADDFARGVDADLLTHDASYLIGTPREDLLWWWGLHHTLYHVGQMAALGGRLREV